jgi:FlaA1/EpsC-like NDP-sugar epimerase
MGRGFYWKDYWNQFWVINLIATILFLGIALYLDIYPNRRFSIQSIIKVNIITFLLLASLTFFFKQFAFSRMVVLLTFIVSPILMIAWRTILRQYYQGDRGVLGKDLFTKPTLVIGQGEAVKQFYDKLDNLKGIDYDLKGWINAQDTQINEDPEDPDFLGRLNNLMQIITMYKIRQIIFSAHSLSYEQILRIMSKFGGCHW